MKIALKRKKTNIEIWIRVMKGTLIFHLSTHGRYIESIKKLETMETATLKHFKCSGNKGPLNRDLESYGDK